jgi:hypothetical protein
MTVPEDEIPSARILYTIVGGRVQFTGAAAAPSSAQQR